MRAAAVLAFSLLVASCGSPQPPAAEPEAALEPELAHEVSAASGTACGELTCGASERCVIQCECCGVPVDPSELRASYRCEPLPPGCAEGGAPEDDCRRLVEIPCA